MGPAGTHSPQQVRFAFVITLLGGLLFTLDLPLLRLSGADQWTMVFTRGCFLFVAISLGWLFNRFVLGEKTPFVASRAGLIVGLANDGISAVPGRVQVSLLDADHHLVSESILDAGYPVPHQVQLTQLELPAGTNWEGLGLKAELIVKGVHHPLRWACREPVNPDGSLTLKQNPTL